MIRSPRDGRRVWLHVMRANGRVFRPDDVMPVIVVSRGRMEKFGPLSCVTIRHEDTFSTALASELWATEREARAALPGRRRR